MGVKKPGFDINVGEEVPNDSVPNDSVPNDLPRDIRGRPKVTEKDFRAVVTGARTAYHAVGGRRLPTLDEIDAVTRGVAKPRIAKILTTERFAQAMKRAGINWKGSKGLTTKQHYALMVITQPGNRGLEPRLKAAGITMGEYRNWIKQPLFKSLVENFAEQAVSDHMAQAHNSLLALVDKQNLEAVKFYYQMTGRFNPQSQVERDINSVLVQVVDIIQRAGLDSEKLEFIAGELRSLMTGSVVPEQRELTGFRSEREDLNFNEDFQYDVPDPTGELVEFEVIEDSSESAQPFEVKEFSIGD